MTEKIYKYVPHSHARAYENCGWEYEGELGFPHQCFASLYSWPKDSEPIIPELPEITVDKKKKKE